MSVRSLILSLLAVLWLWPITAYGQSPELRVRIANVKHGKYAGRVVADVLVGGEKLSDMLIAEGLGRPYEGGRRESWCQ